MAKFEKVSRFADVDLNLPIRKTKYSAGYDFEVARDIIIPSYLEMMDRTRPIMKDLVLDLEHAAKGLKEFNIKPTLVPTGIKCELDPDTYLELHVRSSAPLKYFLMLANGVGVVDADYYNNPDNEGEIFFQIINMAPCAIALKKGDIIGQGIIQKYELTDDDVAEGFRQGGFGSTDNPLLQIFKQFQ